MDNRVAIVTGSNIGIGLEAAKGLCSEGWHVIVACRNPERGRAAVTDIKASVTDAKATFMKVDLADLSSVRLFVEEFHKAGHKLNALINNAGVWMGNERCFTKDGFEMTVGTNHLGHFLLTCLLLDDLKKTAAECGDATIINMSSMLHDVANKMGRKTPHDAIDLDDIMYEKEGRYVNSQAYKDSKLMNVLFTYELARRLEGTGVTVNAMCPGFIPGTSLARNFPSFVSFLMTYIVGPILRWRGVAESIDAARNKVMKLINTKDVTGKFFKNGEQFESSEESHNKDYQKKLWDMSVALVKLEVQM